MTVLMPQPARGGAEIFAIELADRIDRSRFDVEICVSRQAPVPDLRERLEATGLPVIHLDRTSVRDVRPWARLVRHLRSRPTDILHAHTYGANVWASVIGRIARTPAIIATEHTWSYEGDPLRVFLDRHLVSRNAAFVAVSERDRERMIEIERVPAEVTRVIPTGYRGDAAGALAAAALAAARGHGRADRRRRRGPACSEGAAGPDPGVPDRAAECSLGPSRADRRRARAHGPGGARLGTRPRAGRDVPGRPPGCRRPDGAVRRLRPLVGLRGKPARPDRGHVVEQAGRRHARGRGARHDRRRRVGAARRAGLSTELAGAIARLLATTPCERSWPGRPLRGRVPCTGSSAAWSRGRTSTSSSPGGRASAAEAAAGRAVPRSRSQSAKPMPIRIQRIFASPSERKNDATSTPTRAAKPVLA